MVSPDLLVVIPVVSAGSTLAVLGSRAAVAPVRAAVVLGHNSYGDLVDPNPTLKVRRSDLKVYMILVKKVVIVGTTIDLC